MTTQADTATTPSQDERIMAALSHVSTVMLFIGLIAPIVIWATQKDKSAYVRFQALQAFAFQLAMIGTYILGMGCYIASLPIGLVFTILFSGPPGSNDAGPAVMLPFLLPFAVFGSILLLQVLLIGYGVFAAAMTVQGKNFRYLVIGQRVEKFLSTK